MPRRIARAAFWAVLLLTLSACASLGLEAPLSFNERLLYVESTADAVVLATTNALNAQTISSKDAEFVSTTAKQLSLLAAAAGNEADPKTAEGRLELAENVLRQIQTYVAVHGVKK